jgi:hypothetical protein
MHTHHEIRDATQCPQGGNWYTCAETHQMHAYAGCCLVDACNQGCPKDKDRTPPRSNGPYIFPSAKRDTFVAVVIFDLIERFMHCLNICDYIVPLCRGVASNFSLLSRAGSFLERWRSDGPLGSIAKVHAGTTSSEASTPTSDTPTSPDTLPVHVETIASVSAGHTVIVTFVTEHSPPTLEPTFGSVPSDKHNSSRGHVGAIVGGIVGGAALLAAIVLLLLLLRRRRRTKEERRATLPPTYPVIRGGGDMSEQFAGKFCQGRHTFLHPSDVFQVPPRSVVLGQRTLLGTQPTQASSLFLNWTAPQSCLRMRLLRMRLASFLSSQPTKWILLKHRERRK